MKTSYRTIRNFAYQTATSWNWCENRNSMSESNDYNIVIFVVFSTKWICLVEKESIWVHVCWLQTSTSFEIAKKIDWNSSNYVHVMNSHNSDYFLHFESFVTFAKFCKRHSTKDARNNIMTRSIIAELTVLQIFNYTVNWSVQSYTHFETYSKVWVRWI